MAAFAAAAAAAPADSPAPAARAAQPDCRLLEQPSVRGLLGARELVLLRACGPHESTSGAAETGDGVVLVPAGELPGGEAAVNQPTLDLAAAFLSHSQSETSLARSAATGTLCAGYNDSYHLLTEEAGYGGFSRSQDGGASWQDGGALGAGSAGNPSLVWRRADGAFYYAALHQNGIGLWRSADDCAHFVFSGLIHSGSGSDKAQLAVDDDPASPFFGRLHAVFTDFGAGGRIYASTSADGINWSPPLALSAAGEVVQNAWPAVATGGDLYVAWTRWASFPDGPFDIRFAKSTNGGASFTPLPAALPGGRPPRDAGASAACGRPALAGNLRHLPAPQLAAGSGGRLHLVYAADPDLLDSGDASDVFYRSSADGGASWSGPRRIPADAGSNDQFSPTLAIGAGGLVSISWYDRRNDPANLQIDRYQVFSQDHGATFGGEARLTSVSSPIRLDPDLPACYHGDYDGQLAGPEHLIALWSDDRNIQDGHHDADVYSSRLPAPLFGDGFEAGNTAAWSGVFP